MVSDVNRMQPCAYLHRNKLHEKPTVWKALGPLEVRRVTEKVRKMVMDGEDIKDGSTKKVFRENPHTTWDNYFSGDLLMDWLGHNGFGHKMTCRSDRLPSVVPNQYLHKKKDTKARSKAARFHEPINMVKYVHEVGRLAAYEQVHTSFQYTSSCNIARVNAPNE